MLPDAVEGTVGSTGLERLAAEADRATEAAGLRTSPCGALLRPRKAITVMLVGNHSAGKSSLANFLAGARVQEESAPVETRGFSLITAAEPAGGGTRSGRSPVVRIRGRLAVQRASHLALALAATPQAIAAASLRSHSESGPITALDDDGDAADGVQSAGDSASVADLRAVAKLATWTQSDNNHFQDLFDIAFVAARAPAGGAGGSGSRSGTPVSVGPAAGHAGADSPAADAASAAASHISGKPASRAGTPQFRHLQAGSVDDGMHCAVTTGAVFGHLALRGKVGDNPPPVAGVDVIDTPGLVDGSIGYPFDPRAAIVRVALCADVIIVTMDPVGQSLCTRTLSAVRALNQAGHGEKMVYCLTKADTVPNDEQMAKLVAQMSPAVVANMADTHGFHLHPMWLPAPSRPGGLAIPGWDSVGGAELRGGGGAFAAVAGAGTMEQPTVSATQNQLGRVLEKIEAARASRAQAALRTLKGDANRVSSRLLAAANAQRARVAVNRARTSLQVLLLWTWVALLSLAACGMLAALAEGAALPSSLLFRALQPPDAETDGASDVYGDHMFDDWSLYPKCGLRATKRRGMESQLEDEFDAEAFEPLSAAAVIAGPLCGVGAALSSLVGLASSTSGHAAATSRVWAGLTSVMVLAVMAGVVALVWSLIEWRKQAAGALDNDEIRTLEWRARAAAVMHQCGRALEDRLVLAAQRDGEGEAPGVLDMEAEWGARVEDTAVEDAAFAATPAVRRPVATAEPIFEAEQEDAAAEREGADAGVEEDLEESGLRRRATAAVRVVEAKPNG